MKPILADLGRRQLYLLGLLGALKAAGLVLVAEGVATGLAALLAHGDGWRGAVWLGLAGALVRGASTWALQVAAARVGASVKERLRARLLRRAVSAGSGGVGATTTLATTGLDELDRYYTVFLPTLVGAATVPVLVGARILAADWVSALIIVLTVPLIPVFMALIGLHTRERVAEATDALARLSDHLVELARGLPVLVGLGRVREQTAALRDISEDWRRTSVATLRTAFLSALALELISTMSVAVVAVFVGVRLVAGTMPLEAGLVALLLAPECYAPFRDIGAAFHASQTGVDARRRVEEALGEAAGAGEPESGEPESGAGAERRETDAGLRVEGLTVTHARRDGASVAGLSFEVAAGELASLDGPSGAGKSTVLQLLAGRGAALEAGARVAGRVAVPARVALLPQHPQFASASAAGELRAYGATDASAGRLLAAVGLAGAAGADPARLSPGEQRRLAFARVLARVEAGARLVLLDEPTAHLDPASAELVRGLIAGLPGRGAAVLVATHDPEVRALAARHIPVAPGRFVTFGSPTTARRAEIDESEATAAGAAADSSESAPETTPRGPKSTNGHRAALAELGRLLAPVRGRMAGAAAVGSLAALFAAALTALSGWLIVRAAEHPHILFLEVAIVGVRFFGIGRAALRYSERLLTHDAVFAALTELRMRLWRGLAAQGPAGRDRLSAANTLDRLIGDADKVRDLAPRVVVPLVSGLAAVIAAVVALCILWTPAGLLLLAACAVALVGGAAVAVSADARATRVRDRHRSALLRRVAGVLQARDDLAGNGVAQPALAAVARLDARAARSARRSAWALGAGNGVVAAVAAAASVLMIVLAQPLTVHGPLPVPLAAVFAFTPLALIDPLLEAVAAAQRWPELAQVLQRIAPVTRAADDADHAQPGAPIERVRELRLERVGYRYPGAAVDALRDVDAGVGAGEWLVVTGPSGSGKTTLLGVLLRYLAPTRGRYLIDETDASSLDPDAVRRRIAWCPQEGHLFDSTLRGNLAIARGRDDAPDDAELEAVLDRVGLGGLLAELPLGLDTPIGAGGAFLSGGQRQRVAVARTLLAGGDAVLLDEPTAHLDEQAAEALLGDLRRALEGRTTVLVTHHATGVRADDVRLELGAGRLAPADVVRPS
ncbi:thiol reductant ABC exporter subunit CydC [Gryllotalpicola ginsengisoli]|uniref:thiol reductant ABC exporter subunit CydC n=1 Tax=Gryllotalpicola ginsengisoli TaxID=444608 RepID=UPI0003B4063B|nr:thiol reductant ABC exporter subunit CydC [Gryllotalpicola ginsengisoli]